MQPCNVLTHREGISIDADLLAGLFAALGDELAEHCIAETLNALSAGIADLSLGHIQTNGTEVAVLAARISRQAETIGLSTLARVAGDVVTSCGQLDRASIAATLARLARVAEQALAELGDLRSTLR